MQTYDALVVGGGIFGCYAALYLARQGRRVALMERESALFKKASLVNQARLHGGYHYPRSMATALMSDEHKERFTREHRAFIHARFEKYYAIDRFGSFTDPGQFERFCARLNLPCERIENHPLFNYHRLEALYLTEEHSFDPVLLRAYYINQVSSNPHITVMLNTTLEKTGTVGREWELECQTQGQEGVQLLRTPLVINATYAAINSLNRLFKLPELSLTHEISEIAFIHSPTFGERGLTVMDGPFGSIMPYGKSGLLSLSSVAYTHHKISYENLPRFDCQLEEDASCRPERPGICTDCARRPVSNAQKMLSQMRQYLSEQVVFDYWMSYFTIKSKLKSSHIDDSRPTEIACLRKEPAFYCLFAGKVNSIYEVEKAVMNL
jgi:hypothetical protein